VVRAHPRSRFQIVFAGFCISHCHSKTVFNLDCHSLPCSENERIDLVSRENCIQQSTAFLQLSRSELRWKSVNFRSVTSLLTQRSDQEKVPKSKRTRKSPTHGLGFRREDELACLHAEIERTEDQPTRSASDFGRHGA
jgi:hypothetical protein